MPSRLIGHQLRVRLYDDRLDVFVGGTHLVTLRVLFVLIVTERQSARVLVVACDGGHPGLRFRSNAVRMR